MALIPAGQDYFPDEVRFHRASEGMLDALRVGNWHDAAWLMYSTQARPGSALLGLIPAQVGRWLSGAPVALGVWNVLVSLALVWLLYRILLAFAPSPVVAGGGAALYALIHANSLYVRHLLPYDEALLVFMLAFWIILRRKPPMRLSRRAVILCGMLCAFGFTVYPGYYPLIGVAALLVTLFNKRRIPTLPLFILGLIPVVIVFQLISQAVDISFLRAAMDFSSTITQGDFSEGYTFGAAYLVASEGVFGLLLLVIFGAAVFLSFRRRDLDSRVRGVIVLTLLAYLAYGSLATIFHRTVQYGRLIHMYVPFLVMGVTLALISLRRYQRLAWGTVLAVGGVAFAGNAAQYWPLQYPKDVLARVAVNFPGATTCSPVIDSDWTPQMLADCDLVSVDFYDPSVILSDPFVPQPGWQLLFQGSHPVNYVPYQFEGYGAAERAALREHPKLLTVYRIPRLNLTP